MRRLVEVAGIIEVLLTVRVRVTRLVDVSGIVDVWLTSRVLSTSRVLVLVSRATTKPVLVVEKTRVLLYIAVDVVSETEVDGTTAVWVSVVFAVEVTVFHCVALVQLVTTLVDVDGTMRAV